MNVQDHTIDNLSIVIVTWNGDDLLSNCLDSLQAVYGDRPEVVVVDNANMPSTAELTARFRNVRYVSSPENLGFAGGNNLAIPKLTKDYILLLNNDTTIHEDSFSPLLEFLASHPKVGIVQGTMNIPPANDILDVCGETLMPWGLLRHNHFGDPTKSTKLAARRVTAAKGAMLMMRRRVLDDVGGRFFDPSFKNYFEDIDLCLRAKRRGWETWFVPTPPIDHICSATSRRLQFDEVWVRYMRNILVSFHRNLGFWGHLVAIPCFFCGALIKRPRQCCKAVRLILNEVFGKCA